MRNAFILFLFLLTLVGTTHATHIVGGEIELIQTKGFSFLVRVKMYIDNKNGSPAAISRETIAKVGIYNRTTHERMREVVCERKQTLTVDYGDACGTVPSADVPQTSLFVFEGSVSFDAGFTNPAGYYAAFENCCRNGVIKNIVDPINEGMTFYTEIPPITVGGVRLNNSTPEFPSIIDSAFFPCKNKPYIWDFHGTDKDGDSLVYRTATPLSGNGDSLLLEFLPHRGPYDSIEWKPGYSRTNQITGNPPFNIHPKTGIITFTPNDNGLYVFSVEVDEYRNGVKIGMVKRDFQLLIVNCPENAPTAIGLEFPNGTQYSTANDTLDINIQDDTCFTVIVSDSNTITKGSIPGKQETLSMKIIRNTLPPSIATINSSISVSPGADTASVNFCLDACQKLFINKDTTFILSLVVTDAPKCPVNSAFYDTLNVIVRYSPQVNAKPAVGVVQGTGPFTVTRGKSFSLDLYGTDDDLTDIITLKGSGIGFSLAEKGMRFTDVAGSDSISSKLEWTPLCEHLDPGTYKLRFIADDNSCVRENGDTLEVEIMVEDTATSLPFIRPANLITPNGDRLNDVFSIPDMPEGNCEYSFEKIIIYNRWGAKIFESTDPKFEWDAKNNPRGLYYYTIDLKKKEIKGWIEIVR